MVEFGIHGLKPVDPGPSDSVLVPRGSGWDQRNFGISGPTRIRNIKILKLRTGPDQDQEKCSNLQTLTNKIIKILARFEPVGPRIWRSGDPWVQHQVYA